MTATVPPTTPEELTSIGDLTTTSRPPAARRPNLARYLLARRGFLVSIPVLILAWLAQSKFTPEAGPLAAPRQSQSASADPLTGTYLYLAAISLMIVGFLFTYRTKWIIRSSDYPPPDKAERVPLRQRWRPAALRASSREWLRTVRWWRVGLAVAAVVVNLLALRGLVIDAYSIPMTGLWFVSLVLLVLACIRQRRGLWPLEADNPDEYAGAEVDEDGRRDSSWAFGNKRVEIAIVVLIMLVAAAFRLYDLEHIPGGLHTDEAVVSMLSRRILMGNFADQPFLGPGPWSYYPSMNSYTQALGMLVYGVGTIAGARLFDAVAGVFTVLFMYLLLRQLFKGRTALIGAALVATGELAINFSRYGMGPEMVNMCWAACFYFLVKGLRSKRYLDFVWGGLFGGYSLYFYGTSRQIIPFLAVILVFIALSRWSFIRNYWSHTLAAIAGFGFVASPILYFTSANSELLNRRLREVSIFGEFAPNVFGDWGVPYTNPLPLSPDGGVFNLITLGGVLKDWGNGWGTVLWNQARVTYTSVNLTPDRYGNYPSGLPIFAPIVATFAVLGIAYFLWRWRDPRYTLFSLVFWVGMLVGVAFTTATPHLLRANGLIPFFYVFPAVMINKFVWEMERTGWFSLGFLRRRIAVLRPVTTLPTRARNERGWGRVLPNALLAALLLLVCFQQGSTYAKYIGSKSYGAWTAYEVPASYLRQLGSSYYTYFMVDGMNFDHHQRQYRAGDVPGIDATNFNTLLPLPSTPDRNVAFVTNSAPTYAPSAALVRAFYPDSPLQVTNSPDNDQPLILGVPISHEAITRSQNLTATYYSGSDLSDGILSGPPQAVTRTDSLTYDPAAAPANLRYPATVRWQGSLYAPTYGSYNLTVQSGGPGNSTAPLRLLLNGEQVAALDGKQASQTITMILSQGWHHLDLAAALPTSNQRPSLTWANSVTTTIPLAYLWSGPYSEQQHGLYVEAHNNADPQTITTRQVTPAIAYQRVRDALGLSGGDFTVNWRGTLKVPTTGSYNFSFVTGSSVAALYLDGSEAANAVPLNQPVQLAAGDHPLLVAFNLTGDNPGLLHLLWQRPEGGNLELLLPDYLIPARNSFTPEQAGVGSSVVPVAPPTSVNPPANPSSNFPPERVIANPDNTLVLPAALALGTVGNLYVGEWDNGRIYKLDTAGKLLASWELTAGAAYQGRASDMVVIGDRLYVLNTARSMIEVFDLNGQRLAIWNQQDGQIGSRGLSGLCASPDGKLYVTDASEGRVRQISPEGKIVVTTNADNAPDFKLDQIVDCAVGADGSIYASDLQQRIVRYSSGGSYQQAWKLGDDSKGEGGLRLATSGNSLYITNQQAGELLAFDPNSGQLERLSAPGNAPGQFNDLYNVAGDGQGRIYTMERGAKRVQVFARP